MPVVVPIIMSWLSLCECGPGSEYKRGLEWNEIAAVEIVRFCYRRSCVSRNICNGSPQIELATESVRAGTDGPFSMFQNVVAPGL